MGEGSGKVKYLRRIRIEERLLRESQARNLEDSFSLLSDGVMSTCEKNIAYEMDTAANAD